MVMYFCVNNNKQAKYCQEVRYMPGFEPRPFEFTSKSKSLLLDIFRYCIKSFYYVLTYIILLIGSMYRLPARFHCNW